MKLEVGKLYSCKYYLMLYPDKDTVAEGAVSADADRRAAARTAVYWSNGSPSVSYLEKNISILVLNMEDNFYEVLAGDRKGWIRYRDWLELKEINNETIS